MTQRSCACVPLRSTFLNQLAVLLWHVRAERTSAVAVKTSSSSIASTAMYQDIKELLDRLAACMRMGYLGLT